MNKLILFFVILVGAGLAFGGWYFFVREKSELSRDNRPPDDGSFRWGVQLRPYALNRYSEAEMDAQLDLARDLGASWVRLDWHNYNDSEWHERIIDEANKRGLHVVLILEDIGVDAADPAATNKARTAVSRITGYFKGKVKYYQLLNEVSGAAIKSASQPGTDFARDYDAAKYQQIKNWLTGASQGIKAADAKAKIIISAQWTQTAMVEQLIKDGVKFDILGWNWFSDMGDDLNGPIVAETAKQKITLLEKIKGFGKELWLTELGHRPDENGQDEDAQAAYLTSVAERIYNYGSFKGLFVFELMDQAEVASKDGKNEYYGLVGLKKDTSGKWVIGNTKPAFAAYRDLIKKLSK